MVKKGYMTFGLSLILLLVGGFFVNAAIMHSSTDVLIKVDTATGTLQNAIDGNYLVGTHNYSYVEALNPGHSASELWVSVKDGEMYLLQALSSTNKLCPNPSKPTTYTSSPANKTKAYHYATEIQLSSGKTFQQAINDGQFCCIPTTCASLGKNCGTWNDGCGGTLNCGSCASENCCSNGTCMPCINTETVESANDIGWFSSIAIDSNDKIHIAHSGLNPDWSDCNLRYCNNSGGSWSCIAIDTVGNVGYTPSIAIDSNNKIHIAHFSSAGPPQYLSLRYCSNAGGSWSCRIIDTDGGRYPSIAIDSNDKVHISYMNENGDSLKYCSNVGGSWNCGTITTGGHAYYYTSIAIDSNDKAHVSYWYIYNEGYRSLRYCNNTGGSWSCRIIDGSYNSKSTSIAIDSNDKVHISHYGYTDLRYCSNVGGWNCSTIETGEVGLYSSIAIDSNDKVHISHFDETNDDLRYCSNAGGSWSCQKLADADNRELGRPSGRALAIKKGRLVDSTSFSDYAHMSWYKKEYTLNYINKFIS